MAQQYGKVVTCDYPNCDEYQVIPLEQEEAGMGWGQTPDGKDLCADHWQYYCDALAEFWGDQSAPKHAEKETFIKTEKGWESITYQDGTKVGCDVSDEKDQVQYITDDGTFDEDWNKVSDISLQNYNQPIEPIKDEDILYTNMPEMNTVKVTGPSGTVEGHVQEDW